MRTSVEFYIMAALISLMAVLAACYIGSNLYITGARNFHTACINEIEASNYAPKVISALEEDARQKFGNGIENCLNVMVYEIEGNNKIAEVTLAYTYDIPLLELSKRYEITGYAR